MDPSDGLDLNGTSQWMRVSDAISPVGCMGFRITRLGLFDDGDFVGMNAISERASLFAAPSS